MLDSPNKTALPTEDLKDPKIPAIMVTYGLTMGPQGTRQLTLQTGVELDAPVEAVNTVLDKLVDAAHRQEHRAELEMTRRRIVAAEMDVHNHTRHRVDAENVLRVNWEASGKKGPFRLSDNQEKQLRGLDQNTENATDMVRALRKRVKELEELCR